MNGWRKHAKDNIEDVNRSGYKNSERDIPGQTSESIRNVGEKHRRDADGHNPYIGNYVANVFQKLKGCQYPSRKKEEGYGDENDYDEWLCEERRKQSEEGCHDCN